jgi:hypothetical protein
MQIPFIIALIPLFLSPVWNLWALKRIEKRERIQIALDNAAIILGQEDRKILNAISKVNENIRGQEKLHHGAHLCARSPVANPECILADEAFEAEIAMLHQIIFSKASIGRAGALVRAQNEFNRLVESNFQTTRPTHLPVHAVRCSFCRLETQWEWDSDASVFEIGFSDSMGLVTGVELIGKTLLNAERWKYRLHEKI